MSALKSRGKKDRPRRSLSPGRNLPDTERKFPSDLKRNRAINPTYDLQDAFPKYNYKKIGQGGFGTVYLLSKIGDEKEKIVVKQIEKEMSAVFYQEVENLKKLSDYCTRSFVCYKKHLETPNYYYIVMEDLFTNYENLFDLISNVDKYGNLSDLVLKNDEESFDLARQLLKERQLIACQVIFAVLRLHDLGIAHRDIKPENIVIRESKSGPIIKLLDLGLSCFGEKCNSCGLYGTSGFIAPEILAHNKSSCDFKFYKKSDLYSLAVTIFSILSGFQIDMTDEEGDRFKSFDQYMNLLDPKVAIFLLKSTPKYMFLIQKLLSAAEEREFGEYQTVCMNETI